MMKPETRPGIVMYAGCGWSRLIPFLQLGKCLSIDQGFSVVILTHEKFTPGKNEYIQRAASSCGDQAMLVEQVENETEVASYLNLCMDSGVPLCAYIVDSMWTRTPELASDHLNLASELRIPAYIFFRHSASFVCVALFKENQIQNEHQGVRMSVPGLRFIAASAVPADLLGDEFLAEQIPRASALSSAHGIIINSCHELETTQIDALRSAIELPPIYPIGPLMPSWTQLQEADQEPMDGAAAEFLNCHKSRSVLFVFLGPLFTSPFQIRLLALGLEASGHPFLWALNAGAADGSCSLESLLGDDPSYSLSELLPEGFEKRTKGRGLIISFPPPQGFILAHPAIGAFVSHCGWNSTLQSILQGVPIIAWPLFENEQKLIALVLVREMAAAVEVNKGRSGVSRKELERCIKKLMGTKGISIKIRANMNALRMKLYSAVAVEGSSHLAMISLSNTFKANMQLHQT